MATTKSAMLMIKLSSSYVLIITHPPLHRILGMGGSSSSGYPGKYIFLRICSGDFGSVGYISYNVKDPVLLRGLSCAGKLHCPNVIHAKVFCSYNIICWYAPKVNTLYYNYLPIYNSQIFLSYYI